MAPKKDGGGAAGAAPDITVEDQLHQQTVIREGLEKQTAVLSNRITDLEADVAQKVTEREGTIKDFAVFREYATVEINRKSQEIEDLKQQLKDTIRDKDAEFAAMKADLTAKLDKANQTSTAEINRLKAELADVTKQFKQVQEFLQVQADMEAKIAELSTELAGHRAKAAEELADTERRYIMSADALRKEQDANWHELKRLARVEAAKNMTDEQKAVLALNKVMVSELKAHLDETKLLAYEKSSLSHAKASLARDVELLRDAERHWAERGARQARDLKGLATRVQEVEEAFLMSKRQHAEDMGALISEFETESTELRSALSTLRELLELKDKELKTVKNLAGIVLQQRTEVEQLLLDAMNTVKAEVASKAADRARAEAHAGRTVNTLLAERLAPSPIAAKVSPAKMFSHAQKIRGDTHVVGVSMLPLDGQPLPPGLAVTLPVLMEAAPQATAPKLPGASNIDLLASSRKDGVALSSSSSSPLGFGSSASAASASASAPVDYRSLGPEDKERVLKLLLDKINRAGAAVRSSSPSKQSQPRSPGSSGSAFR